MPKVTDLREFAAARGKTRMRDLGTEKSTMKGEPPAEGFVAREDPHEYLGHFRTGRQRTVRVKEL